MTERVQEGDKGFEAAPPGVSKLPRLAGLSLTVLGIVAALLVWSMLRAQQRDEDRERMQRLSERVEAEFARRLREAERSLDVVRSVALADPTLSTARLNEYVDTAQMDARAAGLRSLALVERVSREQLPAFEAAMRQRNSPDFRVDTLGVQTGDLYVIKHVAPLGRNARAWGRDIGAEPMKREALLRAVHEDRAALSERFVLLQDTRSLPAYLLFKPVYRFGTDPLLPHQREKSLLAVAYAGFIMQELMAKLEQVAEGQLDVELFEGSVGTADDRLFAYAHQTADEGSNEHAWGPIQEQTRLVSYGGRSFALRLRSNEAFVQAQSIGSGPNWVLVFGTIASLAMGLALSGLLSSRARVAADARRLSGDVDRLSHVAQGTADAVLFLEPQGQIKWVNEGFARMTGLSTTSVLGRFSAEILGDADGPGARQMAQALASGSACSMELHIQRADGSSVWAQRELMPLRDAQGQLKGFMELLHDVSRLKQAEASAAAALAESQALWRAVEALAIVSVGDLQGNIVAANEAFSSISGYSREELIGRNHSVVNSGQMPPEFWAQMWQTISSGKPWRGQICNRAKSGELYWVDSMIAPVLGPDGLPQRYVSIRVDITRSRLAADEIRRERERLQNIIEGTGAGTWEMDLQTGVCIFSARWKQMLGLDGHGETRGDLETWRSRVHPADLQRAEDLFNRHLAGEAPLYDVEVRMRHTAGRWVWVQSRGQVRTRDAEGHPLTMAGTHVEISDRKRAELHLDKSRRLLDRAERLAHVGSWELDLRGREFSASAGLQQLLERGGEPLKNFADLLTHFAVHEGDRLRWAMELAERTGAGWDLELEFLSDQGRKGWLRCVGSVEHEDGQPRRLLGVLMDVSGQRDLENRTQRSLDLLRSVLNNLPCGLSVFDADLLMVADNPQFRDLLGFPAQLFEGGKTRFEDIIRFNGGRGEYGQGDDVASVVEQIIERARHPTTHAFERTRPNGVTLEVRGAPMPGGGFVTTYVDISERKRLEAEREAATSRLRAVIESLPCGLAYIDSQMDIVLSNARYWEQLGIERDQVGEGVVPLQRQVEISTGLGDYGDLSYEQALAAVEQRVAIALHEPFVWERSTPKGGIMEVRSNPAPEGLVATYTDVTELRQAVQQRLQAEALLRGAIDTVNEAFVLYDPEDRLLFCNEKYRQLYAASADLIVPGASFEQIIRRGAERGQYEEAIGREEAWVQERLAAHRRADTQTLQHLRDDRWVRVVERRMPDGHIVGFRIDITDLMHATRAAEEASQAKSRFLANMSHELRTPMNAILGMLQLLRRSELDPRQRDYAERIDGAARSLLALLNDILDFSKVEAGKMELDPHPFLLDQLLAEVEVILQATRGEKPLWLAIERDPLLPPCLLGDALRLKQVLINLGGNAIKFTAEGEVKLRLTQRWAREERVGLSIEVLDTGIGIAPEHQEQIFAGFTQAEASTTRRFGGTGLGLAISRRLVQLMGSDLTLHSELGKGSSFSFTLELPVVQVPGLTSNPATASLAAPLPARSQGLAGLRVLLVEDNPNNQLVARELLQDEGAQVELAENGLQAVQRLDQMLAQGEPHFDAVLMDVQMPVMDGFTATRQLRERPDLATLPVVAMTANVMASDRAECLAAGMNEHIGKPFEIEALVALLRRLCGRPVLIGPTEPSASAASEALPAALLEQAQAGGLDLPAALHRLGGKTDLFARMARSFARDAAGLLAELAPLSAPEASRNLHGFKGVAGTMGASRLAEMAAEGERQLQAQGALEPAWLEALQGQIELSTAALWQLADLLAPEPLPPEAPSTLDLATLRPDLLSLQGLLRDSDMAALEAFESLRQRFGHSLNAGRLEALDVAMTQLDFAGAARLCADLLDTVDRYAPDASAQS